MSDRFHRPSRHQPRGWGIELRRRLHNAGLSAWELADLLGVHESAITMDALPNQPLHVILELARCLDLHPADHTPSWRTPRRPPDRDALTDLDAMVLFHAHHAGSVSPHDRDTPEWATAIAGLIDSGLLLRADVDTAVLADDVQYGLRLLDSNESTTY